MNWYAIQTGANREERVDDELARLSIEHYFPAFREKRQWRQRQAWIHVPVFRGYTFARIDDGAEDRRRVVDVSGVARIVGAVTDLELDSVRRMMAAGAQPHQAGQILHPFDPGELVVVRHGVLAGVSGRFIRRKGTHGRLIVSLNLIHGAVVTEIDAADVEPVARRAA